MDARKRYELYQILAEATDRFETPSDEKAILVICLALVEDMHKLLAKIANQQNPE